MGLFVRHQYAPSLQDVLVALDDLVCAVDGQRLALATRAHVVPHQRPALPRPRPHTQLCHVERG